MLFEGGAQDRFYTPVARITLGDGREVTRTGVPFPVGDPVRSSPRPRTWQQHLAAQRIAVPGPNCPNRAFGVCDRDFTALFFEHGFDPFPLFALEAGGAWYADRTNVDDRQLTEPTGEPAVPAPPSHTTAAGSFLQPRLGWGKPAAHFGHGSSRCFSMVNFP